MVTPLERFEFYKMERIFIQKYSTGKRTNQQWIAMLAFLNEPLRRKDVAIDSELLARWNTSSRLKGELLRRLEVSVSPLSCDVLLRGWNDGRGREFSTNFFLAPIYCLACASDVLLCGFRALR